jgi:4-hydroxy-tetrahydrodipicolinate synthase
MVDNEMRGVFPILVTPFDEQGRVDEDGLRAVVDFNIESGVHGLGVALGSEVLKLSEAERTQVTRIVVEQSKQRVPVIINSGAAGTDLAVLYSVAAEENGADGLMLMPPSFKPLAPAEVREYFKAVSDAVHIPIFIQDTDNAPVSAALARALAEESANVRYIKVESLPTTVKVAEAVAGAKDVLGIFGGAGGNYFVEEMRRGSVGTMPSCSQPEAYVAVWDLFQKGDERAAREVLERKILPFNRISAQNWGAFYHANKQLLRRRGVIKSVHVRGPAAPLDDVSQRELDTVIDELYG